MEEDIRTETEGTKNMSLRIGLEALGQLRKSADRQGTTVSELLRRGASVLGSFADQHVVCREVTHVQHTTARGDFRVQARCGRECGHHGPHVGADPAGLRVEW